MNKELIVYFTEDGFSIDYETTGNKNYYADDKFFEDFKNNQNKTLFYFGFASRPRDISPSLSFIHKLSFRFIEYISQNPAIEFTKKPSMIEDFDAYSLMKEMPFAIGMEYISINWIKTQWTKLSEVFESELAKFGGTVQDFLKSINNQTKIFGRVFFHLVESKSDDYPFAFLATYSTEKAEMKSNHIPLKNALLEFQNQRDLLLKLLSSVSQAADKSDFLSDLIESGEIFSPLKFGKEDAFEFLKEVPLYEESGILCRIPDWWRKKSNMLRVSVAIGEQPPSAVGLDAILSFRPEIYFRDESFTKEEIEDLISKTNGLYFIKGKWIEVDQEKLKAALEAFERANELADGDGLSFADAMRMQLNPNKLLFQDEDSDLDIEIKSGEWMENLKKSLSAPEVNKNLKIGSDFKADLRHYQQSGFSWLTMMNNLKFGALLADDMGLGKTVQIIAFLEYIRQRRDFKALLIIPASLIGNWEKELMKFAPLIKYNILHGNKTELDFENADLFITTYGMALKLEKLRENKWDILILDEAQAIKNPSTKQTKAVKEIKADFKIAMTGTPIENKLSDLWSIFDFLNKGLLGTNKEFSTLIKNMSENENYSNLKNIISPFILRRLKTDKSIISDLPDKIEIFDYAGLSKKQVVLYNKLVKEIEHSIYSAEGIQRKGIVLASIVKFKQICNHPDQFNGQAKFAEEYSGKFEKLAEICETIREKRESVLIFTQFREMVEPLVDYLEKIFGRRGLSLHGGTAVKKRTEIVEKFQGDEYVPYMVLSLKAGGVGLNLVKANHVIHFDRWWNPAIENQATDRVFRIGQAKNVMVHKMITTGTIEEKIDKMINDKQKLAGEIIAKSEENWITELSNDDLMKLFKLEVV